MKLYVLELLKNDKGAIDWTTVEGIYLTERKAKDIAKKKYGARDFSFWHKGNGRYFYIYEINFTLPSWLKG